MQIVPGCQNTKVLAQFLKLLLAAIFRGAQNRQRHGRAAQVAHKRGVRGGTEFLQVSVGFENFHA